jgi:general L-amino acid transport system permease protein
VPKVAYVREDMVGDLPAPNLSVGVIGWMRENLFNGVLNTLLTLFGMYLLYVLLVPLFQFAVADAVWTGEDREACVGQHGACWAYVKAYFPQFIYGRYPEPERWRVDIVFVLLAAGLIPMLIPSLPYKKINAIFLLLVFPVTAFILLTGGNVGIANGVWYFLAAMFVLTLVMVGLPFLSGRAPFDEVRGGLIGACLGFLVPIAVVFLVSVDYGLNPVQTDIWGGLLVTLVIAITGITASLPIGVMLALGRRSNLPVIKLFCVIFIEFWRGVPLITVLFMSSVLLPLFMPEGVTIDKLFRALVGVAMFASAYMAEVVRGGLQAIPKGQYEGADALGLTFWQKMNLIVLPQALKLVIPGIVNTFIGLFKDTTLVLIIGLFDLLGQVQSSFTDPTWSTPTQSHSGYLFAALIFWVFCFGMSRYSIFMENRLDTSRR